MHTAPPCTYRFKKDSNFFYLTNSTVKNNYNINTNIVNLCMFILKFQQQNAADKTAGFGGFF